MNRLFLTLSFFMGTVVLVSNYLVQFPFKHYGLEEILTYGAFSYPIAFLITDLTNRRYGKQAARKIIYFGFFLGLLLHSIFPQTFPISFRLELPLDQEQLLSLRNLLMFKYLINLGIKNGLLPP